MVVILSFTKRGSEWNRELCDRLSEMGYECEGYGVERFARSQNLCVMEPDLKGWVGARWGKDVFVFIGAIGIAVRCAAPWLRDKYTDSAVIAMDEEGKYVVPLIAGHVGGAVEMARDIARCTKGTPVITTATDVQHKFAVDVFAKKNQLTYTDRELAKRISAAVLEEIPVGFYTEYDTAGVLPKELQRCRTAGELEKYPCAFAVTKTRKESSPQVLQMTAKDIILGIGCRKDISAAQLEEELKQVLKSLELTFRQVALLASIDLKERETAIMELAAAFAIPYNTYTARELNTIEQVSEESSFVAQVTGVDNVCERAARFACPKGELILPKTRLKGVTAAIVRKNKVITFE